MNKIIKNQQYSSSEEEESDGDSGYYNEIDDGSKSSTPFNRSSTLVNISSTSKSIYSPPSNINLSGPDNAALIGAFQTTIDFYQKYVAHSFFESRFALTSLNFNKEIVPDALKDIVSNSVNVLTNVAFNFFPELITPRMQMNQFCNILLKVNNKILYI